MNKNTRGYASLIAQVDEIFKNPYLHNMENIEETTGFSRQQVFDFFSLYKTLVKLSLVTKPISQEPLFGISRYVFENYFKEFVLEDEDFMDRVYIMCDSGQ
jgi:hypothetical protein